MGPAAQAASAAQSGSAQSISPSPSSSAPPAQISAATGAAQVQSQASYLSLHLLAVAAQPVIGEQKPAPQVALQGPVPSSSHAQFPVGQVLLSSVPSKLPHQTSVGPALQSPAA